MGRHSEVVFGGEGGVGGLDRGDEGGGVLGGGGNLLDAEEVGALGGDSLGAFRQVVGGEDESGAGGAQAVALGDGGVDGFPGDEQAVAVGAEEVGGGNSVR